jgi:hypothetical protein
MDRKRIVRLRNLENTLAQFKQERKELDISIPYIESQIAKLHCLPKQFEKDTCILPIAKGKRKPTIGIDMLTGEVVSLKTGKAFPPLQATAKGKKK